MLIEDLGDSWAAFSPASGGSHLLNDSSAAIIEVLSSARTMSEAAICAALALETDQTPADIEPAVRAHWDELIRAGLIREVLPGS